MANYRQAFDDALAAIQANDPMRLELAYKASGLREDQFVQALQAYQSTHRVPEPGPGTAVASGAAFNFSDELGGAADAMLGARSYEQGRDMRRLEQDIYAEQSPGASLAGNLAGGMLTGGPGAARAAIQQGGKALIKSAAKYGAAGGALAGAGAGGSVGERLMGAGIGGVAGGTLGAAVPAAGVAAAGLSRRLFGDPERVAAEQILAALMKTEGGVKGARMKAAANRDPDKPMSVMDVGGEPVRRLARGAAAGDAEVDQGVRGFLNQRARGQMDRVENDLRKGLGAPKNAAEELERLSGERAGEASQAFGDAFAALREVDDPQLIGMLASRPSFRNAWAAAQRLVQEREGQAFPPLFSETGEIIRKPSLQELHYVKMALSDRLRRPPTAARGFVGAERAAVTGNVEEMLGRMDQASPAYAQARQQYADKSSLIDATEAGREFFRFPSAEQLQAATRTMGAPELEMFRAGAFDAIRTAMRQRASGEFGGNARNQLDTILGTPDLEARMRAIFPGEKAYAQFMDAMRREAEMVITNRRVLGGSNTADKLADVKGARDLGSLFAAVLVDPVSTAKWGAARAAGGAIASRVKRSPRQTEALSRQLTTPGREATLKYLRQLQMQQMAAQQRALIQQRVMSGAAAGGQPAAYNSLDMILGID